MTRIHCLGVGAIGSLLATNLAQQQNTTVRLILRHKDYVKSLSSPRDSSLPTPSSPHPLVSLKIEREGLVRRTDNFEVELTPNQDSGSSRDATAQLQSLVRHDPISTLFLTTKAPHTLASLRPLLPRLSAQSTVVLCQNGMGVLEQLLEHFWPEDTSDRMGSSGLAAAGTRPSFVCATTTHGVWRKGPSHFVHAGMGDIQFGVVPNRAVLQAIASTPDAAWGDDRAQNPLLNPRSLINPTINHLTLSPTTASLHQTVTSLLQLQLRPKWLPLPTLQIAQLQKLTVNTAINALTATLGVPNGALVGSSTARYLIEAVASECGQVFAAHLAREEGRWDPPPLPVVFEGEESTSEEKQHSQLLASSLLPPPATQHPTAPLLPHSHPLSPTSLADHTMRVAFHTSTNHSSTLQDLLAIVPASAGGPAGPNDPSSTEIAFIHGYVCKLAKRYGIHTPVVASLGALVRLKEEVLRSGAVDLVAQKRVKELHENEKAELESAARKESGTASSRSRRRSPTPATAEELEGLKRTRARSASPVGEGNERYERAARYKKLRREWDQQARERRADKHASSNQ